MVNSYYGGNECFVFFFESNLRSECMSTEAETTVKKIYKGVTDLPIEKLDDDNLHILNYIEGLSDFIRTCATPMTIALQGDWGTGKTSFMNLVIDQLEKKKEQADLNNGENNSSDDEVITIVFNTWKYAQFNQEQNLSLSFLSYVISQLYGMSISKVLSKAEEYEPGEKKENGIISSAKIIGRLMSGVTNTVVSQVLSSYLTGTIPMVQSAEITWKDDETNAFDRMTQIDSAVAIEGLKKEFIKAVEYRINQSKTKKDGQTKPKRVAIFIDDLDRLDPVVAVNLLEVIKIFLDVPNCVFILSVDYAVVTKGVKLKNRDYDMDDEKAHNFFDKMIQVPFRIPMEFYNFEDFLRTNLPEIKNFANLHDLIRHSIGNNPRGVKRLLNSYYLISNIMFRGVDADQSEKQRGQLIALLCMQLSHEPLYRYFCLNIGELNMLLAQSDEEIEQLLNDENISYSKSNVRKHVLFLRSLRRYLFGNKPIEDISRDNEDDDEVLELFSTTLSYTNITSETVAEEIEEVIQVPLKEVVEYSAADYGVLDMSNDSLQLKAKSANGLAFEIYRKVFQKNPHYIPILQDYKRLPDMKAAGIEKRLILPFLEQLDKQPEAKMWIEQNIPEYAFKKGEYSTTLSKKDLPGVGYAIITNYSALGTIQNLYHILNYLEDDHIANTVVRLKKRRKA